MDPVEHYREHGYVVPEQVLPRDLVAAHAARVDALYAGLGLHWKEDLGSRLADPAVRERFGRAMIALHASEAGLRLALEPRLRRAVLELLGEEVVLASASATQWVSEAPPHSDTLVLFRDPPEKVCRTWCALEDLRPDSGLLYMIPGTHRAVRPALCDEVLEEQPEFIAVLRDLAKGGWDRAAFTAQVAPINQAALARVAVKVDGLPRVPLPLRAGDAVAFSMATIHGALPRSDPALTRKALILEWHARSAQSFLMSAYYGARHDHRRPENVLLPDPVAASPWGGYAVRDAARDDVLYGRRMQLN